MKHLYDNFKRRVWLRDILSSLAFFLMMLVLDWVLRSVHDGIALTKAADAVPWIFTLIWAAGLTVFLRVLPRLARRIAVGVLGALFNLLFITNALMYSTKGNFFSFSSLIFAGDGFKFLSTEYLQVNGSIWFALAAGILLTVAAVLLAPKLGRSMARNIVLWSVSAALVVCCFVGVYLNKKINLSDRLAVHFDIHQQSLIYDDFSDSNESLMLAGMYQYTLRDFCITYGVYDTFSRISDSEAIGELDDWYASKPAPVPNEMTGVFEGKNLILIQLEAMDTWMIDPTFTPRLYALQEQSVDFTQCYTPIYLDAGTFNTELIVNTGTMVPFTGSRASMFSRNAYPYSLASLMRGAGYTANSFHRSLPDVYNRGQVHLNWGYEKYYSGPDMGIERMDFDIELMRAYDAFTAGDKFFSFIITYSAHGPYKGSEVSAEYYYWAAGLLPADTPEMKIHALAHAHATDVFIGALLDKLEQDGKLDNTVLALYSDHYDYYTMDTHLVKAEKGVDNNNLMTRTPFFIYCKGMEPRKVDKVTASYDILPTLVNMFLPGTETRYFFGNDAFSDGGGYAIFADYSWYDGTTYYNVYGSEAPTPEIAARNEELQKRLKMSWNTVKYNYFTKIQ